ncbi:glycoside hydrolase family 2 TIM barrel-domain containing protein [Mucilaginibacter sp. Mucisp86]|uniref:glycoside hydrolase family 2 TIM barrel-domain containing protein n=1 Tax=Mucilaginibacter sp. Mucisp86 TaxID=3243060 RepID=UPI0039B5C259
MLKKITVSLILCLFSTLIFAQTTIKQSINTNWAFHKGDIAGLPAATTDASAWQKISLPHSWNTTDANDDEPGYYRGIGWYKKTIYLPAQWKDKQLSLFFEGANEVAEVYVNGKLAGKHTGGYTAFNIPVNTYLKPFAKDSLTANEIMVKLDNSHNEDIPPLDADFTFYGGVYRDVYIVASNQIAFDNELASPGIRIKTPSVSAQKGELLIEGTVNNLSAKKTKVKVISELVDADGKVVAKIQSALGLTAGAKIAFSQKQIVANPHLWSPEAPYLYHVVSKIIDASSGQQLDGSSSAFGFRWFSFDADKGFFLNGNPVKLIGTNRHQDFQGMANAIPDAINIHDMELLKAMGANFIRIAHYPQDPSVLEACDRLGILASVETPEVNRITETAAFADNAKHMQLEMIHQNFNHPSIIIWAYMNEVEIVPRYKSGSDEQKKYFVNLVNLAKQIDSLTRKEDPSRYTMIPCHGDFDRYYNTGLAAVPQIVGWNLYYGWYAKDFAGLDKFLEKHHQMLPTKPMIITEFGADADSRLHSVDPERFDKTVEYEVKYHRYYLERINKLPFVAGGAIWNLVDFNAEQRQEATPHINTKGLLTNDRQPKEAYFFYQANLLRQPFIKIGTSALKAGNADENNVCLQPVNVYSNQPQVKLWLNGKLQESKTVQDGMATFTVPFTSGKNTLKATAGEGDIQEDFMAVDFNLIPHDLNNLQTPFTELNVSLGDRRQLVDDKLHQVWVPEQPYTKGSWGYVGGEIFTLGKNGQLPYGSNKNILETNYDPIYQTQRVGLSDFKLDVPAGKYEVTLHFAELTTNDNSPQLVYNLNNSTQKQTAAARSFDVLINGQTVIEGLSNSNYLEPLKAYSTKIPVSVGGDGITISFKTITGQAILNGLQVRKVY